MVVSEPARLCVIVSCRQHKVLDPAPMPAVDRYLGGPFGVIRKSLRELPPGTLSILIVSAEHGLLRGDDLIGYYDREMTIARAAALRPAVGAALDRALTCDYTRICLTIAGVYYGAIGGSERLRALWTMVDVFPPTTLLRQCGSLRRWIDQQTGVMR